MKEKLHFFKMSISLTLLFFLVSAYHLQAQTTIANWNIESGGAAAAPNSTTCLTGGCAATRINAGGGNITSTGTAPTATTSWQIDNFPNASVGNKTAGAQFTVSTLGYNSIQLSFDLRARSQSSNTFAVQYSTTGVGGPYTDAQVTTIPTGNADVFINYNVNLSGITALNNNANVVFRIVTAFSGANYVGLNGGYNNGRNYRFDNVNITGNPICAPTTATTAAALTPSTTSMNISWTNGNGANRIVVMKAVSAVAGTPTNGTAYAANPIFGSGSTIAANEFVVYNGNGSSVNVTGLTSGVQYCVAIYEYGCASPAYLTTTPATACATTLCLEPNTSASAATITPVGNTFNLSWTNGNGTGRLVVIRQTSAVAGTPTDGTAYTANTAFGSGSTIAAGEFVVYNGVGTSATVTGLTSGQTYCIAVFEYACTPINYKQSTPATACGTVCAPSVASTAPILTPTTTTMNISWTNGNGANRIVVMKQFSAVVGVPVNGTSYTANSLFGSGSTLAGTEYVVYNGSGTSVTVTGLNPKTQYCIAIYEYGCATPFYLTSTPATACATTLCPEPSVSATAANYVTIGATTLNLAWTNGAGTGRLVVIRQAGAVAGVPVDGTAYTANPVFGSGGTIAAGEFVVYNGVGTSVNITGLTPGTNYCVAVFEYDCTPINYKTTTPSTVCATTTLCTDPVAPVTSLVFNPAITTMNLSWTNGTGLGRIVIMRQAAAVTAVPVDGVVYPANAAFGTGGTAIAAGQFVVYAGSGNNVTVTGLLQNTNYCVAIYEYNCTPIDYKQLTPANGCALTLNPQLVVTDNNPTAAAIIAALEGDGVVVSNVAINCGTGGPDSAYGLYALTGTIASPGMTTNGTIITSGRAANAIGPNNSGSLGTSIGIAGSATLDAKYGVTTFDACEIAFDIIPNGDSLKFRYTFGSEEYPEYVGSDFNDVFGFYISNVDNCTPYNYTNQNMATIPGTATSILINNVNAGTNPTYFYTNNVGGSEEFVSIQYDGITRSPVTALRTLIAHIRAKPCCKYRIRLIVADVQDRIYDSGALIEPVFSPTVSTDINTTQVFSGCVDPILTFTRPANVSTYTMSFTFTGTATLGTHFTTTGAPALVSVGGGVYQQTFGSNVTTTTMTLTPNFAAITVPVTVNINRINVCDGTILETQSVTFSPLPSIGGNQTICQGATTTLSLAIPYASYRWEYWNGASWVFFASTPTATVTFPRQYRVKVSNKAPFDEFNPNACIRTSNVMTLSYYIPTFVAAVSCPGVAPDPLTTQITLTPSAGAGAPYTYSFPLGSAFAAQPAGGYSRPNGTTYDVSIKDLNGCLDTLSLTTRPTPTTIPPITQSSACLIPGVNRWLGVLDNSDRLICALKDLNNNMGMVSATVYVNPAPQMHCIGPFCEYYLQRSWLIDPANNTSANVRLFFTQAEYLALNAVLPPLLQMSSINDLGCSKYKDYAPFDIPNQPNTPAVGDYGQYITPTVRVPNYWVNIHCVEVPVTSFSEFYLHSNFANDILPVDFVSFKATRKDKNVLLDWVTASEKNNMKFEIEVAVKNSPFEELEFSKIGEIAANNPSGKKYEFLDEAPNKVGIRYYRIKQVDQDGKSTYTKIESIIFIENSEDGFMRVNPNPFGEKLNVEVFASKEENIEMFIYDMKGVQLAVKQLVVKPGFQIFAFEAGKYPKGAYLIKAIMNGKAISTKAIKE